MAGLPTPLQGFYCGPIDRDDVLTVKNITMKLLLVFVFALVMAFSATLRAETLPCPAGLVTGKTLDEEFGVGTQEKTRCLKHRSKLKLVVQPNKLYQHGSSGQPYMLKQMKQALADYEVAAIIFGEGAPLALNNDATAPHGTENPFQPLVQELMDMGVGFYFCQNTGGRLKVQSRHVLPGFKYVTSGLTAIVDFQNEGYVPLVW